MIRRWRFCLTLKMPRNATAIRFFSRVRRPRLPTTVRLGLLAVTALEKARFCA